MLSLSYILHPSTSSQLELVGNLGGDVFKGNGRSRYALEPNPVEGETGQLAHFHLPLDEVVPRRVPRHAHQHVTLSQLILAAV